MGNTMSKPILVKENHQLIDQLEQDLRSLVTKFREDTGLLITYIDIEIEERHIGPHVLGGIKIAGMVKG